MKRRKSAVNKSEYEEDLGLQVSFHLDSYPSNIDLNALRCINKSTCKMQQS